jgi:hypothetical protein
MMALPSRSTARTSLDDTAKVNRAIRVNTIAGMVMLAFVALGVLFRLATGDSTPSAVQIGMFTVVGLLQLLGARSLRRDRDDPAGIERRSRHAESVALTLAGGVPLLGLLAIVVILVFAVLR